MQVARKNGRFIAARAGAHLKINVALITRVDRHQQQAQGALMFQQYPLQTPLFFFAHVAHIRVGIVGQFGCGSQFLFQCQMRTKALCHWL